MGFPPDHPHHKPPRGYFPCTFADGHLGPCIHYPDDEAVIAEALEASEITPEELRRRIVLARTPTIATDDALTVAKLHDLVVRYVLALEAYEAIFDPEFGEGPGALRELETAYARLKVASGVQS